jgi:hypothetical protein
MPIQYRPIALAVSLLVGFSSAAHAGQQDQLGLMLNIPFDSAGMQFKDAVLNLVYRNANINSNNHVDGWQLTFGSRLNTFSPVFSVSGLSGDRCAYGSLGVSYGGGQWGIPFFINGPYAQLGLANVGGFGGVQMGVSSLGCFKRYVPSASGTSGSSGTSGTSGSSGSSGTSGSSGSSGTVSVREVATLTDTSSLTEFDWA